MFIYRKLKFKTLNTYFSHFWKVHFMPFCLYSLTERHQKRFLFLKKKKKGKMQKYHSAFILQQVIIVASCTPSSKNAVINHLPRFYIQHKVITLNCVCEHLCFILDLFCTSIHKICSKISEKPNRSQICYIY